MSLLECSPVGQDNYRHERDIIASFEHGSQVSLDSIAVSSLLHIIFRANKDTGEMNKKKVKHLKTVLIILGALVGLGVVGAAIAVPVKLLTGTTTSGPSESTAMRKSLSQLVLLHLRESNKKEIV